LLDGNVFHDSLGSFLHKLKYLCLYGFRFHGRVGAANSGL
jgi:hypothetical protein